MTKIIAGSNTVKLAEGVSKVSGFPLVKKTVKKFPDGETYVKLEDTGFKGEDVFIIHSLYPEQNENLFELFLTIDTVRENGGIPYLVIPYLAYARQDKVFEEGEAFSLKALAKIFKSLGVEKLITIDAHFHRDTGDFDFFGLPAQNISAVSLLVEHAKKNIGDFIVVGPDEGSKDFLKPIDDAVFLKKKKEFIEKGDGEVHYKIDITVPEIASKNILLIDDIISTGGTVIVAVKALKESGKSVHVASTHGIFARDSLKEIRKHAEEITCTDTVESECSNVSVAGIIAENLR